MHRAVPGAEHRGLPLEPEDGAERVGLAKQHARVVDQIARGEVVGAVQDDVIPIENLEGVGRRQAHLVHFHADVRVDGLHPVSRRFDLRTAHRRRVVQDLPLQVARVNIIAVDDAEGADAGGGQVHRRGRAEAAGADQQHPSALQPALAIDAHVRQDDVPGIAGQLFAGEIGKGTHDRDSLQ
jgi:hypothetical protein